ncbi:MAG: UbiA prenyltransferase family protein [Phycisphaerales bacterium]|nr:UbiA prenyltransferase family protein [Phycisphaerales bacterium]
MSDTTPAGDPTDPQQDSVAVDPVSDSSSACGGVVGGLIKLARPHQWTKGVFVLLGPAFAIGDHSMVIGEDGVSVSQLIWATGLAFFAFCLAASGCYVFNDLADVERDRVHPRKRRRPIASGRVSEGQARVFGVSLLVIGLGLGFLVPGTVGWWVGGLVALYIVNVMLYTAVLKHIVIFDVLSLSSGFVLRVLGGCAAVAVTPSTWLLNATLFLSMFLAFGKRLGERRVMGNEDAAATRGVLLRYSDQTLRMMVVVVGVATLLTYTGYVQSREGSMSVILASGMGGEFSFNLLWVTVMPAMVGLLRTITLIMEGRYDDPTELALRDPIVRYSGVGFVVLMVGAVLLAG